jgi:hypothetical protein
LRFERLIWKLADIRQPMIRFRANGFDTSDSGLQFVNFIKKSVDAFRFQQSVTESHLSLFSLFYLMKSALAETIAPTIARIIMSSYPTEPSTLGAWHEAQPVPA